MKTQWQGRNIDIGLAGIDKGLAGVDTGLAGIDTGLEEGHRTVKQQVLDMVFRRAMQKQSQNQEMTELTQT